MPRLIMLDDADVMVAGGPGRDLPHRHRGFNACKALSTDFNDRRPGIALRGRSVTALRARARAASSPRDTIAKKRGRFMPRSWVTACRATPNITAPPEMARRRAMKVALKRAGLGTDQIDYVNAHGTSTIMDVIELVR